MPAKLRSTKSIGELCDALSQNASLSPRLNHFHFYVFIRCFSNSIKEFRVFSPSFLQRNFKSTVQS